MCIRLGVLWDTHDLSLRPVVLPAKFHYITDKSFNKRGVKWNEYVSYISQIDVVFTTHCFIQTKDEMKEKNV